MILVFLVKSVPDSVRPLGGYPPLPGTHNLNSRVFCICHVDSSGGGLCAAPSGGQYLHVAHVPVLYRR